MAEVKLDINSLKPNSHKYKQEQAEKEKKNVQKVVKGEVIAKSPGVGKRVADVFLSEDVDTVKGYVLFDVILPAIKNMLADMVTEGINVLLFGSSRGRSSGGQKTPYNSMSKESYRGGKYVESYKKDRHNYKEIILDSRDAAEEVLDNLLELIAVYGEASLADLYSLVGVTSEFTDNKWGWLDLKTAGVRRVREGYLLELPKAILLD